MTKILLVLLRAIKSERSTRRYQTKHFLETPYSNFNEYFTGISMDWFSIQQKLLNTQQLVFPSLLMVQLLLFSTVYYRTVTPWLIFSFGKFDSFLVRSVQKSSVNCMFLCQKNPLTSLTQFSKAVAKGQLISKANYQAKDSSKKWTNKFIFASMRRVFVHFLEESSARKNVSRWSDL